MYRPGDHIPRPDLGTDAFEIATPDRCPNGHPLRYPWVSCDYTHCGCRDAGGGHASWFCWLCGWTVMAVDHVGENPVPPRPDYRPAGFVLRELRDRGIDPDEPGWEARLWSP